VLGRTIEMATELSSVAPTADAVSLTAVQISRKMPRQSEAGTNPVESLAIGDRRVSVHGGFEVDDPVGQVFGLVGLDCYEEPTVACGSA
jgi:hypothetical protein